ncbi:putative plant self-incompatibility S1 [Medicago truncatula]|uniref:S-protein homolog n=1 Tax=Medicago truncatula TaxID=3880 RepID=A0A072TK77_MEDTR|nr:S-protein homolog 5 [Medicago truncatula]KEH17586.1 leguminosin group486 secreted peptide [Medicago truncatula]RHN51931.1 putative plant self-incompatibility S1 [Medicago truncatula]
MAASSSVALKFSILLIILLAFEATETIAVRVTVTIINQLPAPFFILRCQSRDNDLKVHNVQYGGSYTFSFKPSVIIFKTTLFFCSFTWPSDHRRHYLNVYDEDRDGRNNCDWEINIGGGCLSKKKKKRCFPWRSIKPNAYNTSKIARSNGVAEWKPAHPLAF